MNYYNEIDPFAASWLRELIKAGHISNGVVDERSIEDVLPSELVGFKQCHFFAGVGVWSYALRQAGWPDDREVWTGSCPCQPFSAAGKRTGTSDERHLWPSWFYLIEKRKPGVVFGEQVDAAIRQGWLDLVQSDMEGIGYTVGAQGLAACCVGAPHQRKRLYFVANTELPKRRPVYVNREDVSNGQNSRRQEAHGQSGACSEVCELAYNTRDRRVQERPDSRGLAAGDSTQRLSAGFEPSGMPSFWSDCDWIQCTDGKQRPVEPGTFPLAHGATARVGRLRGYGNAIVAPVAKAFIESYLESE